MMFSLKSFARKKKSKSVDDLSEENSLTNDEVATFPTLTSQVWKNGTFWCSATELPLPANVFYYRLTLAIYIYSFVSKIKWLVDIGVSNLWHIDLSINQSSDICSNCHFIDRITSIINKRISYIRHSYLFDVPLWSYAIFWSISLNQNKFSTCLYLW